MSDAVLAEIKAKVAGGQYSIDPHAQRRMRQRGAQVPDVERAVATATTCYWSTAHQSWQIDGGVDIDGDDLFIACVIEADVLIVTIF